MNKNIISKQAATIWHLDNTADLKGMGAYGTRFEIQRDYYRQLSEKEKLTYEDAVLLLSQEHEVLKAKLGLNICAELADFFSDSWHTKVIALVKEQIRKGLRPSYKNSVTSEILVLIHDFNITSSIPDITTFSHSINQYLNANTISASEWVIFHSLLAKILIKLSPEDFWLEINSLIEESACFAKLSDTQVQSIMFGWERYGANLYGTDWLRMLVRVYAKSENSDIKKLAIKSIKTATRTLMPTEKNKDTLDDFFTWASKTLGTVDCKNL